MTPSDAAPRGGGLGARVLRTFAFSAGGQLVGIAHQLVLVPFFLRAWGDETYGDWLAATAVASYLSLADMGVQSYAINRLGQEHARAESDAFRRSLHSAWLLYALLAAAGSAVLGLLALLLPWGPWFDGHALAPAIARNVATIAGAGVLASVAGGFVSGIHKAFGEAARSAAQGTLARLLLLVVTVAALASGLDPVGVAFAVLGTQVVTALVLLVDAVARHPEVRPSFAAADRATVRAFLAPSLLFLLVQLAYGLTVQGTVIVASAALGGAAAAAFATVRTLVNVVRQAVQLLGNSLWPELTRLESTHDPRLAVTHRLLVKGTALVTAALVPALATAGPALYGLWTSGRVATDTALLRWLLAGMALQAPWLASSFLLAATNRHAGLSALYVVQGVVAVGLSAALAPAFGTVAMGVALASTDFLVFGVLVPRWAQAVTGESMGAYVRGIYLPYAGVLALAVGASVGAWSAVASMPLAVRIVTPFVATSLAVLVAARLWFVGEERTLVADGLRRVGRRVGIGANSA